MHKIRIVKPGTFSTIQDLGRYGYQKYGIPVSGAMDRYSLQIANILVGNKRDEACIEVTMIGPTIKFIDNQVFAVTGAEFPLKLNDTFVEMNRAIEAKPKDILEFGVASRGCRGYISFAGGIDIPSVLGSKSTYIKAQIGGIDGRILKNDDILSIKKTNLFDLKSRKAPEDLIPAFCNEITLRVIIGPEIERFSVEGINTFFNNLYELSTNCDRMGYRLNGPKINHVNGADIISSGINMGTVQITPDGLPIIMMADRQTIGGYTRIANVIGVDIPLLSQLVPGSKIRFKEVDIDSAQKILLEQETKLSKFELSLNSKSDKIIIDKYLNLKINGKSYKVSVRELI